jgi:hypothetical protein
VPGRGGLGLRCSQASAPPPSGSPASAPRRRQRGGPSPAASDELPAWPAVSSMGAGGGRRARSVVSPEIGQEPMSEWVRGELRLPAGAARCARGGPSSSSSRRSTCPPDRTQKQISKAQVSDGNWKKTFKFQACLKMTYCSLGLLRGLVLYESMQL